MRVLQPGELRIAPNVDFITEEALDNDDPIVDTFFNFTTTWACHLAGRKYIKLSTVRTLAEALGYELVPTGTKVCECPVEVEREPRVDDVLIRELTARIVREVTELVRQETVEEVNESGDPAGTVDGEEVPVANSRGSRSTRN